MNNKTTSRDVKIVVERRFGTKNLAEIYAEFVGKKIAEAMYAANGEQAEGENECGRFPLSPANLPK